jgi:hypothetical protein
VRAAQLHTVYLPWPARWACFSHSVQACLQHTGDIAELQALSAVASKLLYSIRHAGHKPTCSEQSHRQAASKYALAEFKLLCRNSMFSSAQANTLPPACPARRRSTSEQLLLGAPRGLGARSRRSTQEENTQPTAVALPAPPAPPVEQQWQLSVPATSLPAPSALPQLQRHKPSDDDEILLSDVQLAGSPKLPQPMRPYTESPSPRLPPGCAEADDALVSPQHRLQPLQPQMPLPEGSLPAVSMPRLGSVRELRDSFEAIAEQHSGSASPSPRSPGAAAPPQAAQQVQPGSPGRSRSGSPLRQASSRQQLAAAAAGASPDVARYNLGGMLLAQPAGAAAGGAAGGYNKDGRASATLIMVAADLDGDGYDDFLAGDQQGGGGKEEDKGGKAPGGGGRDQDVAGTATYGG